MNSAYLLLGSNEGERAKILSDTIVKLKKEAGNITSASALYETAAWGDEDQPDFINQVIHLNTKLTSSALLDIILTIENEAGRQRKKKWGQRTLDIDILLYNYEIVDTPTLQLPHPQMHLRRFTLIPMVEIAPAMEHPVFRKTMQQLLDECPDDLPVKKI